MSGFEPRISGVGSNRSANCATTTALKEPREFAFIEKGRFVPFNNVQRSQCKHHIKKSAWQQHQQQQ